MSNLPAAEQDRRTASELIHAAIQEWWATWLLGGGSQVNISVSLAWGKAAWKQKRRTMGQARNAIFDISIPASWLETVAKAGLIRAGRYIVLEVLGEPGVAIPGATDAHYWDVRVGSIPVMGGGVQRRSLVRWAGINRVAGTWAQAYHLCVNAYAEALCGKT